MPEEIDKFYRYKAEEFVDSIFDKNYFNPSLKREDIRKLEELLAFLFQSYCNSAVKCSEMVRKVKEKN